MSPPRLGSCPQKGRRSDSEWELRVSQKEIHRMQVVGLTIEGRETVGRGARLFGISARQMKRLRRKMKEQGVQGLVHANRGK